MIFWQQIGRHQEGFVCRLTIIEDVPTWIYILIFRWILQLQEQMKPPDREAMCYSNELSHLQPLVICQNLMGEEGGIVETIHYHTFITKTTWQCRACFIPACWCHYTGTVSIKACRSTKIKNLPACVIFNEFLSSLYVDWQWYDDNYSWNDWKIKLVSPKEGLRRKVVEPNIEC